MSLTQGALTRTYVAHVPAAVGKRPAPLVIALHGFGGNGANVLDQGRWIASADAHGFIVLAPDGVTEHPDRRASFLRNPRSWNSGPGTGSYAERAGIDDIGFLRSLIDTWISAGRADPQRIFVTGFSNGAAMTFRAGAELSDRITAIAPVANSLLVEVQALHRPVSLLMIWGDADPLNPIEGGRMERGGSTVVRPSGAASFDRWSALLACTGPAVRTNPAPKVTLLAHADCREASAARFYTIAGLGHQWPGGETVLRVVSGPQSDALDATAVIWQFFAQVASTQRDRGTSR